MSLIDDEEKIAAEIAQRKKELNEGTNLPKLKRREVNGIRAECAKCIFSDIVRPDPKVLQTVRVCRRGPPGMTATAVKIDSHGRIGSILQIQLAQCAPAPEDWCYSFVPGERIESSQEVPPASNDP